MSKTYDNLTEKQRNAVLIDDKNALISASAGSGKTFVVIERITRLIIEKKADLSQILAVTFTKLAANEMKEKLKTSLLQEINNGREDLKDAYDDVFDADISTIHAFCSKLLKKYFYLVDIDYSFEVIEESKKKKLLASDIGYLKVLARGSIDKPLTVYADDFSLGAIKMIALTGGRTFHVRTRPKP